MPTDEEFKHHIPKRYIVNDKFLSWVYGHFPVDRLSDKLMNDKPNKYAAYYHFARNPLLQNGLVLKAVRMLFGGTNSPK